MTEAEIEAEMEREGKAHNALSRLIDRIGFAIADLHSEEALAAIAALPRRDRLHRIAQMKKAYRMAKRAAG